MSKRKLLRVESLLDRINAMSPTLADPFSLEAEDDGTEKYRIKNGLLTTKGPCKIKSILSWLQGFNSGVNASAEWARLKNNVICPTKAGDLMEARLQDSVEQIQQVECGLYQQEVEQLHTSGKPRTKKDVRLFKVFLIPDLIWTDYEIPQSIPDNFIVSSTTVVNWTYELYLTRDEEGNLFLHSRAIENAGRVVGIGVCHYLEGMKLVGHKQVCANHFRSRYSMYPNIQFQGAKS